MNLYAYAGNNPIAFADPFGLCPQHNPDCWKILAMLKEHKGGSFQTAALAYEVTNREVHIVSGADPRLGVGPVMNTDGNPRTAVTGMTPRDGNYVALNKDTEHGDFLMAAVHEAEHLMGRWHSDAGDQEKMNSDLVKAFQELTPGEQSQAPLNSDAVNRLTNGRVGQPLPANAKEHPVSPVTPE